MPPSASKPPPSASKLTDRGLAVPSPEDLLPTLGPSTRSKVSFGALRLGAFSLRDSHSSNRCRAPDHRPAGYTPPSPDGRPNPADGGATAPAAQLPGARSFAWTRPAR